MSSTKSNAEIRSLATISSCPSYGPSVELVEVADLARVDVLGTLDRGAGGMFVRRGHGAPDPSQHREVRTAPR